MHCRFFPRQRGNVSLDNLNLLNAILSVAENACTWQRLPKEFGNWHSIYTRMSRWSKNGTLAKIFERLQRERLISVNINVISLDSTSIKVHPDGMGALKKAAPQFIGKSRGGWTSRLHLVAASVECPLIWHLSPGNAGDAPQGRKLLEALGHTPVPCSLLMDRAYEGNETQRLSRLLGHEPTVPPHPLRRNPWNYAKEVYKRRNEVKRLFRRLKGFRRIATRYDKLDALFLGFIMFVFIVEFFK